MKTVLCYNCGTPFEYENVLSRGEECPKCGDDLKACLNCRFYDKFANNQCTEPQAEPVKEKDRANFCGYFEPGGGGGSQKGAKDPKEEAKKKLDALFKK